MYSPTNDLVGIANHGAVRVITLQRPDKLNAFNNALYRAAGEAVAAAASDASVNVAIITGAGRAFSAGQDLEEMAAQAAGTMPPPADGLPTGFPVFVGALSTFPKPMIAAVNGMAIGIGATMLPHCDLVIIDEAARIRTPFTLLGVAPEAGSSLLFPERMGFQQAARVLFTSDWISAEEAVRFGLALQVAAAGHALDEALVLAQRIAGFDQTSLIETKQTLLDTRRDALERAQLVEGQAFARIFAARRQSA